MAVRRMFLVPSRGVFEGRVRPDTEQSVVKLVFSSSSFPLVFRQVSSHVEWTGAVERGRRLADRNSGVRLGSRRSGFGWDDGSGSFNDGMRGYPSALGGRSTCICVQIWCRRKYTVACASVRVYQDGEIRGRSWGHGGRANKKIRMQELCGDVYKKGEDPVILRPKLQIMTMIRDEQTFALFLRDAVIQRTEGRISDI